ncbi:hypothetical protein FAIPA1_50147 [Frankia sp. AiPs1]
MGARRRRVIWTPGQCAGKPRPARTSVAFTIRASARPWPRLFRRRDWQSHVFDWRVFGVLPHIWVSLRVSVGLGAGGFPAAVERYARPGPDAVAAHPDNGKRPSAHRRDSRRKFANPRRKFAGQKSLQCL